MSQQPQLRVIATPSTTRLKTCLEMFMHHREASQHTEKTSGFYEYTLRGFLSFLTEKGIPMSEDIQPHHVREFIVHMQRQGCKDTTVHSYARAIKTFCNFLTSEGLLRRQQPHAVGSHARTGKEDTPPFSRGNVEELLKACQEPLRLRDRELSSVFWTMVCGSVSSCH